MLIKDLRYAARNLLNARGFTVVAILTLALGIGAATSMFSVVNGVLLRPLPYHEPERLVAINEFDTGRPMMKIPEGTLSYPDYIDVAARNHSFESVAAYTYTELTLTGLGEPLHIQAQRVTPSTFHLLGVQPELGRSFLPDEDGPGHHVVIISDRLWREHFNAEKSVLGRAITLAGHNFTIVGVMPRDFQFVPRSSRARDLWTTLSLLAESTDPRDLPATRQRGNHFIFAIARLKPGVTLDQANSDLASIYHGLAAEYPASNLHSGIAASPEIAYVVGSTRTQLLVLFGAVGLVLLVACANVANLLLARGAGRAREIATRAALGATRMRVVRQLLTESLLLSLLGAAIGIWLARWALVAVLRLYPLNLPRAQEIGIDYRVLLFTAGLAILTGILFGLLPAWRVSAPNLSEAMREGGRSATAGVTHNRLRSALIVTQTAFSVMLLIGAGLLLRSFERLSHADLGFQPGHLLTATFDLSEVRYTPDAMDRFIVQLMDRLHALPGVTSVAGAMPLPLGGEDGWSISFNLLDQPVPEANQPDAGFYLVTNGFFETMKIPLLRGRTFDSRDQRNSTPVMIITDAFARKFFPGEDPIGRKIKIGAGEGAARARYKTREIVAVVGDIRVSNLAVSPAAAYYVPLSQLMWGPPTLVLRTSETSETIVPAVSRVLTSMDPDAPLYQVRTMDDWLAFDLGRARFQTILLGLFAGIALLLAAIGLGGAVAYSVAQRTQEIGVRIALGASRSNVLALMINRGVRLTLLGLGIGVAGALVLARVIQSLLYQTAPRDPATYVIVCATLGAVALLASYLPALRATRIDPVIALRHE